MAGKGGGAWKVAYADFVTAMMAFFLVMWLCAQDLKVRQSVAKYFMDPAGSTNKPGLTGSVVEFPSGGNVPREESVALGHGRQSYSQNEHSRGTKLVGDWLAGDNKTAKYWKRQAEESRKIASVSSEVVNNQISLEEASELELAKQLKARVTRDMPLPTDQPYRDLLLGALAEVNWSELARDLLLKD
jgi:flagellar motor protein MotB